MWKCQNIAATDDRAAVSSDENVYLRRYVKARDNGNAAGAAEAWSLLMHFSYDRVAGFVRLSGRKRLRSETEVEEAISEALMRLFRRMSETFEGTSMGEYVNATKQLCEYAVLDVQRSAAIRTKREVGSVDDTRDDGEGGQVSRFNGALKAEAEKRAAIASEALEASAVLSEYIPRLKKERSRVVVEHMRDGVTLKETATELDVSETNAYQLRTRALKELKALIEEDQS
jgi:RNA polymerase sigma factor (sigma-70 family)